MELIRKPFQGVLNIIRFNWPFFLASGVAIILLGIAGLYLPAPMWQLAACAAVLAIVTTLISLCVSWYIYDVSDLYELTWLEDLNAQKVLTINAGFDETSDLIRHKSPQVDLAMCDFYNAEHHTEPSIQRARQAYPPKPGTLTVSTNQLPYPDGYFDTSLAILSAHEIRDEAERVLFFQELLRVTKSEGKIVVLEHLRDWKNFLAYTIGFLHFHSKKTWLKTFELAGLAVESELKSTPFISVFILEKHGNSF